MGNEETKGLEKSVQTMLFYYITSLIDTGVQDTRQYVATVLPKMINLTEEQSLFVQTQVRKDRSLPEKLRLSVELLKNIEKTGKLDMQSITLVRSMVENMYDNCKEVLEMVVDDEEDEDYE